MEYIRSKDFFVIIFSEGRSDELKKDFRCFRSAPFFFSLLLLPFLLPFISSFILFPLPPFIFLSFLDIFSLYSLKFEVVHCPF